MDKYVPQDPHEAAPLRTTTLLAALCVQDADSYSAAVPVSPNWVSLQCYFWWSIRLTNSTLGFAGNDSPSFVFPTAIATKGPVAGSGGSGSGRPAVANKPSYLTGGTGGGGHLQMKRGTEDLDFFIGDEALAAANGPGV
jgi:hypothetical protein